MRRNLFPLVALFTMITCSFSGNVAFGQATEDAVVQNAAAVLQQAVATPGKAIPRAMLRDAQGVAIFPNVIKGGLIIGARHGRGVLVVRDEQGAWQAPVFVTLSGGNIGWQIGVQASDLVLVFKTRQSVQGIMNGKFTIGADASAAAGPVGRQAAAATDGTLKAEIYTYSRSRGLFAGVAIDGSVIQIDPLANALYYRSTIPDQPAQVPQSAVGLVNEIAKYTGPNGEQPVVVQQGAVPFQQAPQQPRALPPAPLLPALARPAPAPAENTTAMRQQLVQSSAKLFERLDGQWGNYLALPREMYDRRQPPLDSLEVTLSRFNEVAANNQYRKLSGTADFQQTHAQLRAYTEAVKTAQNRIQLPPPPGNGALGAPPTNSLNLRVPDFNPPVAPAVPADVRQRSQPDIGFNRLSM